MLALSADRDLAVVADAHVGLQAPDERPPGAGRGRTEDGSSLGQSLLASGVGGSAQFAVDFVLVDVGQELVEQAVGAVQFEDLVGGQQRGQAFLPVMVAAFNFAFSLRGGGVAQVHPVKVEGLAKLGEGLRIMRVEEGVVVHVERQRQAVGLKASGQEIEVGQERLAGIEAGARVVAGGVVQKVEQHLFVG